MDGERTHRVGRQLDVDLATRLFQWNGQDLGHASGSQSARRGRKLGQASVTGRRRALALVLCIARVGPKALCHGFPEQILHRDRVASARPLARLAPPPPTVWTPPTSTGLRQLSGELPVNTDGGLKTFGHPTGATGVRMIYENVLQLRGQAEGRQVKDATMALSHNIGGPPQTCGIAILGMP